MPAYSPAAERNQEPILAVLSELLPASARVLEIASGTGQHAAHFAAAQPGWRWQPSDGDAGYLADVNARCALLSNVAPALHLDVGRPQSQSLLQQTLQQPQQQTQSHAQQQTQRHPPAQFDAIYCANLLHIAPWTACAGLTRIAASHLLPDGVLVLYGPFIVDGEPTAPSNLAFDADLRARDPRWGLRRLVAVEDEARSAGLTLAQRVAMPANNLLLVFRR